MNALCCCVLIPIQPVYQGTCCTHVHPCAPMTCSICVYVIKGISWATCTTCLAHQTILHVTLLRVISHGRPLALKYGTSDFQVAISWHLQRDRLGQIKYAPSHLHAHIFVYISTWNHKCMRRQTHAQEHMKKDHTVRIHNCRILLTYTARSFTPTHP